MIQTVEEPPKVCIDDPPDVQVPASLAQRVHCLMRAAAWAKPIGAILKVLFIDRSQQHGHGPLDYLVLERRLPDRTFPSVLLVEPDPFHGWRLIPPAPPALVEVAEVLFPVLGVLLGPHPVDPRRAVFARLAIRLVQEVHIDQVG